MPLHLGHGSAGTQHATASCSTTAIGSGRRRALKGVVQPIDLRGGLIHHLEALEFPPNTEICLLHLVDSDNPNAPRPIPQWTLLRSQTFSTLSLAGVAAATPISDSPCESDRGLRMHSLQQIFDVHIDSVETYNLVSDERHAPRFRHRWEDQARTLFTPTDFPNSPVV